MANNFPSLPDPLISDYSQTAPLSFISNDIGEGRAISSDSNFNLSFVFSYDELNTFLSFLTTINQIDEFQTGWDVGLNKSYNIFRFTSNPQISKLSDKQYSVSITAKYLWSLY
jgi:hypothetical protein